MLLHPGYGLSPANQGAAPPAAPLIPLNTRLIFVGDSITNVSNAASSNHRSYRHWLNFFTNGHFYCTPASNQGVGGGTLTSQADATRYVRLRDSYWLAQVSPGTAVMFAVGTNDGTVPTLQQMIDELQTNIDNVLALGGIVFVAAILPSVNNQTPGANLTRWTDWNNHVASLHNPAGGVYALTSRATAIGTTAADLYDTLHPTGKGARLAGMADAADLLPYLDTSESLLYGSVADGDNLHPDWDLDGTGGVAGTGATGQVADGWAVYCTSNGTSGGSTIGLTATCSKTTVDIPGVGTVPAQQIDISGTASGLGIATLVDSITSLTLQFGDYMESWAYVKITATDGSSAPVGINTLYAGGTTGAMFSKTVDSNAGDINGAIEGVLRSVPTMKLSNANSEQYEVSVGIKAGTVDVRIIVAQMGAKLAETVAYGAPFNLGGDTSVLGAFTNPIGNRPRLNGTPGVGNVLTLQPATINGGGPTFEQCRVKRDGVTILTKNPGDTPMTYTQVAGDSGTTLTLEHEFTNSFGNVVAVSAGIVVP